MEKICTKCKISKSLDSFHKRSDAPCKYRSACRNCRNMEKRKYIRENKEKVRQYYEQNKDRILKWCSEYYEERKKDPEFMPYRRAYLRKYWDSPEGRRLHAANEARRRAAKSQATPPWAYLEKIKQIYLNCPEGYDVDHIIPLRGKNVRGLHVEYNLQYLPHDVNVKKGNRL